MNSIKIKTGSFDSKIWVNSSKSTINRYLILAALKPNCEVTLQKINWCTDVIHLIDCLKRVGIKIIEDKKNNSLSVLNSLCTIEEHSINHEILNVGDGGTTFRFLLSFLALSDKKYSLKIDQSLEVRPHEILINLLQKSKVSITKETLDDNSTIYNIKGPVCLETLIREINSCAEIFELQKSSQYLSALLLILQNQYRKINLEKIDSNAPSKSYVDLTVNCINKIATTNIIENPLDYSALVYPVCYGLINGPVVISNCFNFEEDQAEKKLFEFLLLNFGEYFEFSKEGLKVKKINTQTISNKKYNLNFSNYIDAFCPMVLLASFLPIEFEFNGLSSLIYKESDRLDEVKKLLNFFNIDYQNRNDQLIIKNSVILHKNKENEFIMPNDHRIIMLYALFLSASSGGKLLNIESVFKSWPEFFTFFQNK